MEKEHYIMKMEILYMRMIGLMIKKKVMENIFLKNGYYYIGQFKDDLKNGKGIEYYKNGNIKYEGDFINDKSTLNCIIN